MAQVAANDVHAKALAINLSNAHYGSFAEIGAGQEVARWFLRVGAASGTVAQTISAYDKTFSDDTYGSGTRYVSKQRLLAMLDHEYRLLVQRLGATRGADTRFFVFADTVAARNYKGDNEQHGWLGVRFQAEPGAQPSDVLVHVNLMDPSAQLQQEAIGVLGVNLVYAAFHQRGSCDTFLVGIFEGLSIDRIEIDVIDQSGPAFAGADSREWCIRALRRGMAHAVGFDQSEQVVEPSNILRKRALIVERGRFDRVEPYQQRMLKAAQQQLLAEGLDLARDPASILEMTTRHISGAEQADDLELLERVQHIAPLGGVVISDFPQTYLLAQYLRRYTQEPIRFVVGVTALAMLFHADYYADLPGTMLEAMGRFLSTNTKVYAYPMPAELFRQLVGKTMPHLTAAAPATGLVTADDLHPPAPMLHLYRYVREAGWVVPLSV